jgi:hypothetical protein
MSCDSLRIHSPQHFDVTSLVTSADEFYRQTVPSMKANNYLESLVERESYRDIVTLRAEEPAVPSLLS